MTEGVQRSGESYNKGIVGGAVRAQKYDSSYRVEGSQIHTGNRQWHLLRCSVCQGCG
jgi:hypothetical protein